MQKRRHSLGRTFVLTLGLLVAAAAALLAAGYFALPLIAEIVLPRVLAARGYGPAEINIEHLNVSALRASEVSVLGGAVKATRVEAEYSLADLWRGEIRSVTIAGLRAEAAWDEQGFRVGNQPFPPVEPSPAENRTITINSLAVQDAIAVITMADGPVELQLDAVVTKQADGTMADVLANLRGERATATAAWKGTMGGAFAPWTGGGKLDLDITNRALPGITQSFTAQGALALEAAASRFVLTGDAPLSITLGPMVESAIAALPAPMVAVLRDQGAAMRFGGSQGRPRAVLETADGITKTDMDLVLETDFGGANITAAVLGQFSGSAGSLPQDFVIDHITLDAGSVPMGLGTVNASARITELRGPLTAATGKIALTAQFTKPAMEIASADDLNIAMAGGLLLDGKTIAITPDTADLTAREAKLGQSLALPGVTAIALAPTPPSPPALTIAFGAEGATTLTYAVDVALRERAVDFIGGDTPQSFVADLPRIHIEGALATGTDASQMTVAVSGGRISHGLLEAVDAGLQGQLKTGVFSGTGELRLVRLLAEAPRGQRQPANARGPRFTYQIQNDSQATDIAGKIFGLSENEIGTFSLRNTEGGGTFSAEIPRRTLGDAGLAAHELLTTSFPLTEITGDFGLKGTAAWGPSGTKQSAEILLADMNFNFGSMEIQGLNTVLTLNGLAPPRSAAPQSIAVAAISVGLPLTDLTAEVALPGDGTAVIRTLTTELAGGRISGRDQVVPIDGREGSFHLAVDNVSITTLAEMSQLDGLSATGTLSGTIPVRVVTEDILVENGKLESVMPGNIRYQPADAPAGLSAAGGSSDLLMKALANFQYDSLALTLNGSATKELAVGLALKGRNPDLYGGYPIEFNLNLSGALSQIMRQSLVGYRIPEDIERQLNAFGAPAPAPEAPPQ